MATLQLQTHECKRQSGLLDFANRLRFLLHAIVSKDLFFMVFGVIPMKIRRDFQKCVTQLLSSHIRVDGYCDHFLWMINISLWAQNASDSFCSNAFTSQPLFPSIKACAHESMKPWAPLPQLPSNSLLGSLSGSLGSFPLRVRKMVDDKVRN